MANFNRFDILDLPEPKLKYTRELFSHFDKDRLVIEASEARLCTSLPAVQGKATDGVEHTLQTQELDLTMLQQFGSGLYSMANIPETRRK